MADSQVFISYSHKDKEWRDRLLEPLRALEKNGHFHVWVDTRLEAGDLWESKVEAAIAQSDAAILLVTNAFLGSDFISGKEMPRILKRHAKGGTRIFPVIVKPCPWQDITWLAKLQVRPEEGRPLARGTEYDIEQDLADLAREVLKTLKAIKIHAKPPPVRKHAAPRRKKAHAGRTRIGIVSLESGLRDMGRILERLNELQKAFSFEGSTRRLPVRSVGHVEGEMQLKIYRLPEDFQKDLIAPGQKLAIALSKETLAFVQEKTVFMNYLGAPSSVDERLGFVSLAGLETYARRAKVSTGTAFAYTLASHLAWQLGDLEYHDDIAGCPMDFVEDHAESVKGLRRGAFCDDCAASLSKKLHKALEAILTYGRG